MSNSWGTGGSLPLLDVASAASGRPAAPTGPARLSWSETVADRREQARGAFERRSWSEAFAELATARDAGELGAEDLERLAVAAYMVGQDDACETAWMDAHRAWAVWTTTSARPGARSGALGLFFRGDLAPAMGWVAVAGGCWNAATATRSNAPG